jgi:hypothetical protein
MTGGCRCGAIRYEIASFPLLLYTCNCTGCRRQTGTTSRPPSIPNQMVRDMAAVLSFKKIVPIRRNRPKPRGITVGWGGCFGQVDCGKSEERNLGPG